MSAKTLQWWRDERLQPLSIVVMDLSNNNPQPMNLDFEEAPPTLSSRMDQPFQAMFDMLLQVNHTNQALMTYLSVDNQP